MARKRTTSASAAAPNATPAQRRWTSAHAAPNKESSSTARPAWLSTRSSARSHGRAASERLHIGSLRACLPPSSGLPEPIHSGMTHATGIRTSTPIRSGRRRGSVHQAQSPYTARNENSSGRKRQASVPSTTTWVWRPSSCRSIAHSMSPTAIGASLPCAVNWNQSGARKSATAATAPPIAPTRPPRASLEASRTAIASARSAPVRATTIQSAAGSPASTSSSRATRVVKTTGSGFHDGPPVVSSPPWASSRPHTSQAQGSCSAPRGGAARSPPAPHRQQSAWPWRGPTVRVAPRRNVKRR